MGQPGTPRVRISRWSVLASLIVVNRWISATNRSRSLRGRDWLGAMTEDEYIAWYASKYGTLGAKPRCPDMACQIRASSGRAAWGSGGKSRGSATLSLTGLDFPGRWKA
jgi:hypothetical protein